MPNATFSVRFSWEYVTFRLRQNQLFFKKNELMSFCACSKGLFNVRDIRIPANARPGLQGLCCR
jgi:hypothetical protein